ncbi:TenA family protein [Ensifer sp. IC3342]|nr:TenA family protein [Ensifer sp. BRP08]MCA1450461.1 TenA family protein [Ensifer sp. IC3342]
MSSRTLSEQMLDENVAVFQTMVNHRFVEDIRTNRLSGEVFDRYLVFEGAFIDTAISIFAYGVAKAETIEQKRWLIAVLDALANRQIAYFEKTFTTRGINPADHDLKRPAVEAFRNGMLEIARGGTFPDIIAAMFAAEWMYWTWSKAAAGCVTGDPLLKEWVAMHADDDFAAQASWLRSEIDEAGAVLTTGQRARLSSIFGHVLQLEIAFHDAPYEAGDPA